MKTLLILTFTLIFINYSSAQKLKHNFFLGTNISSIDIDLEYWGSEQRNGSLKNGKWGFNAGYLLQTDILQRVFVQGGIKYINLKSKFSRPHNDNSITAPPRGVTENLDVTRVVLPLNAGFSFIKKNNFAAYIKTGVEFIVVNSMNRTADYLIPGGPSGFIKGTYEKRQKISFNNDNKIGSTIIGGAGANFKLLGTSIMAELIFASDISKSKFNTLHNIEDDGYFHARFKRYEINVGISF